MNVVILGANGYIGTALFQFLKENGHEVTGVDNNLRRDNVMSVGSNSVTDKVHIPSEMIDISKEYHKLAALFHRVKPDAIVHLAEQPSAAFSMKNQETGHLTLSNNILGTFNVIRAMKEVCPDAQLVKLGTEGEYPDWLWDGKHIPEGHKMVVGYFGEKSERKEAQCKIDGQDATVGYIEQEMEGWEIPVPRAFGSIYHGTKFFDSFLIDYLIRVWGITATDVNQGVVYGHEYDTRLDYDECFGTVVNRFCVQAVIGHPLTVYGTGGQTRGFIALRNSLEAIRLLIENPPEKGEFRVIHQTTKEYSVMEIAEMIQDLTGCEIECIENPRVEMAENHFTFENKTLMDLGLEPIDMREVLPGLIKTIRSNSHNINEEVIMPKTKWQ